MYLVFLTRTVCNGIAHVRVAIYYVIADRKIEMSKSDVEKTI